MQSNFTFKFIEKSDYLDVLAHLKDNFYRDEPVTSMFGMSKDREVDLHTRYTHILKTYPKSLKVIFNENPGKIAAVLIIRITDINNPLPEFQPRSEITKSFLKFLEQAEAACNIQEMYGLSKFPELAILSVDPEFRGKGLATELYRRATSELFSDGYPLLYSEFSNPFSRKVGAKLGFKEISRFYFKEFKNEDGTPYFPEMDKDDNGFVSLTVLEKQ